MRSTWMAIAFLFLSVLVAEAGKPVTFELIEFPGADATHAWGINSAGDVVGTYETLRSRKGWRRSAAGEFSTIDVPGSFLTEAYGIDDDGRIVGVFCQGDPAISRTDGFLFWNGEYTVINYPGSEATEVYGVNAGRIVGFFFGGSPVGWHGFLLVDGQYTQLDVPGSTLTLALGIGKSGQVVGTWDDASQVRHGFIYTSGTYQTIDFPRLGAFANVVYSLNSSVLLGSISTGGCTSESFLYSLKTGRFSLLDIPGASATGINDAGMVVGDFGSKGFIAKASSFAIR